MRAVHGIPPISTSPNRCETRHAGRKSKQMSSSQTMPCDSGSRFEQDRQFSRLVMWLLAVSSSWRAQEQSLSSSKCYLWNRYTQVGKLQSSDELPLLPHRAED